MASLCDYFLLVPLSDRLQKTAFGRHDAVDGTVGLKRRERCVLVERVVEDLQFDAFLVQVTLNVNRAPKEQPIVGAGGQKKLKPQHKISVGFFRQQIAEAAFLLPDNLKIHKRQGKWLLRTWLERRRAVGGSS